MPNQQQFCNRYACLVCWEPKIFFVDFFFVSSILYTHSVPLFVSLAILVSVLICLIWTRCYAFSSVNVRSSNRTSQLMCFQHFYFSFFSFVRSFVCKQQSCINYLWFKYQTYSKERVCVCRTKATTTVIVENKKRKKILAKVERTVCFSKKKSEKKQIPYTRAFSIFITFPLTLVSARGGF